MIGMIMDIGPEYLQANPVFIHPDHGSDAAVPEMRCFSHIRRYVFPKEIMIFHHSFPINFEQIIRESMSFYRICTYSLFWAWKDAQMWEKPCTHGRPSRFL
jgi:hypothetical protein